MTSVEKAKLLVFLENRNFPSKRSLILVKKEGLNIVSVPLSNELNLFSFSMFNVFSLFRFSSCLLALTEFYSIQVVTNKAESTSKQYLNENLFLK